MGPSKLAQSIKKAKIRVMYDLAREMDDVISLTVGEPDFQTPQKIIDVSTHYFNQGLTKYTPNDGMAVLKEAIADTYEPILGRRVDPKDQVMITVGAQEALVVTMQVTLDPGDEDLICTPHYPSYIYQAYICHATPVLVQTREENGWMPLVSDIKDKVTDKTKMLILTSPCNPTGGEIDRKTLEEIAAFVRDKDIIVISDECYNRIRYSDEPFTSIASFEGMEEKTVVINSFSKTYAMPGWRMGFAIGPKWIVEQMPKTHDVTVSCVCAPFQYAAAFALKNCDDEVAEMLAKYRRRRDIIYKGINSIDGLSAIEPKGAFYLFFNIKETGMTSEDFAFSMLREERLALVPGDGFGEAGEGYIRLTYAASEDSLERALERIDRFMKNHR